MQYKGTTRKSLQAIAPESKAKEDKNIAYSGADTMSSLPHKTGRRKRTSTDKMPEV